MVSVTGSGSYLNENFVIIYCLCCHLVSVPEKTAKLKIVNFVLLPSVRRTEFSTMLLRNRK